MLTKTESAKLLQLINAYVAAVVGVLATADSTRRVAGVDSASQALERLLEYVEEIS
jgi:hypothetical protein